MSCLHTHTRHLPDLEFYTDASGTWGCGAYYHPHWLKIHWPESWRDYPITIKELLPIILAVAIWGQQWSGKHIRCRCDNMAVVNILYSRTSKDSAIMHRVRFLHFFLAHFDIKLIASHIAGKSNDLADALSRNPMHTGILRTCSNSPQRGYYHPRDSPRNADNRETRLVLASLEAEAHSLVLNSIAPSTSRVYSSARNAFLHFCSRLNLNPLPASEHTLILFVAELHQSKATSTIHTYMAGVRHLHIISSYTNPLENKPKLQLALKGCKRRKTPRACTSRIYSARLNRLYQRTSTTR